MIACLMSVARNFLRIIDGESSEEGLGFFSNLFIFVMIMRTESFCISLHNNDNNYGFRREKR